MAQAPAVLCHQRLLDEIQLRLQPLCCELSLHPLLLLGLVVGRAAGEAELAVLVSMQRCQALSLARAAATADVAASCPVAAGLRWSLRYAGCVRHTSTAGEVGPVANLSGER